MIPSLVSLTLSLSSSIFFFFFIEVMDSCGSVTVMHYSWWHISNNLSCSCESIKCSPQKKKQKQKQNVKNSQYDTDQWAFSIHVCWLDSVWLGALAQPGRESHVHTEGYSHNLTWLTLMMCLSQVLCCFWIFLYFFFHIACKRKLLSLRDELFAWGQEESVSCCL